MINNKHFTHYDNLNKLANYIKSSSILGHKLTYIKDYAPFTMFSLTNRDYYDIDDFSPLIKVDDSNTELFNTTFYRDINACQGNNFLLGFDNGDYLNVDCWADNELTLWITRDINNTSAYGGGFNLMHFFDNTVGKKLVDIKLLTSDEWDDYPDEGGDIRDNGDICFIGRLKLIFDGNCSLVFACNDGMPRITSYIGDLKETCNYWHVASCSDIRQTWIIGQNVEDIESLLLSNFDKTFVDDAINKINTFNDYQLQNVWSDLCIYSTEDKPITKEYVTKLINYYVTYPNINSRDTEIIEHYATYIANLINRRDMIDEDLLISNCNSIIKMRILLDKITQIGNTIKADQVIDLITDINNMGVQ